jgi:UDP-N-acetylglucosamine--N-acetylmuramyl-(pentapeptide) pyrophosphoryl-undecaprenol N-acetylglucosamine transferase
VKGRTFVTGNPVRPEFFEIGPAPGGARLSLLVFGGSRGARTINRATVEALAPLARISPAPRIVHQTGESEHAPVSAAYAGYAAAPWEVLPFLDDMPRRLAAADLAVCRSGASTIAELCAAGRPAVLVPFPHAADDHQRHNAETLERAGAAVVVADRDLDGARLAARVAELAADPERLRRMGAAARTLARPRATDDIADIADRLLRGADAGGDRVP